MAVSTKLKQHLDENNVRYVSITHSRAFTAQQVAASMHIRGRQLAKTVIVKAGQKHWMAVLPANHRIDLAQLSSVLGGVDARLAHEEEVARLFPECETGAMPPFGNLYGMDVVVDATMPDHGVMYFNGGTHTEVIEMAYEDFERLVHPRRASFATHV